MEEIETGDRFCPGCGYNLRGLEAGQCPECGLKLVGSEVSPIPWEHRREIGRAKAFWRTVVLVTFRPGKAGRAVGGPMDRAAAGRFQTIVALLAAGAVLWVYAVVVGFYRDGVPRAWGFDVTEQVAREVMGPGLGPRWEARIMWSAGATQSGVILVGSVFAGCIACWFPLFSVASLGVEGVRRERMKALGAYACAPLAWTPVCAALFHAYSAFGEDEWRYIAREGWLLFTVVMWVVNAVTVVAAWWSPLRMFSVATHGGWWKALLAGIAGLPGNLLVGMALGLGIFPSLMGLVWIAVNSLRTP